MSTGASPPHASTLVRDTLRGVRRKQGSLLFRRVGVIRTKARAAGRAFQISDLAYQARFDRARMADAPARLASSTYVVGNDALTVSTVREILKKRALAAADHAGPTLDVGWHRASLWPQARAKLQCSGKAVKWPTSVARREIEEFAILGTVLWAKVGRKTMLVTFADFRSVSD